MFPWVFFTFRRVHLPPIKISAPIPFTGSRLSFYITSTASELVFRSLRVRQASGKSRDAGREPIKVSVSGISTDFSGSFSVKLVVKKEARRGTGPSHGIMKRTESDEKSEQIKRGKVEKNLSGNGKQWKFAGSGRVDAQLQNSALNLSLQLVTNARSDTSIEVLKSAVDEGWIESAKICGFGPFGRIATKLIPWVRGTIFVRWPTKLVSDFLIRDLVEGPIVVDLLKGAWNVGDVHMDLSAWNSMKNEEREQELETPLDTPTAFTETGAANPAKKVENSADSTPAATNFRFHSHLIGPTVLRNFPLPDVKPQLYRPGGTRAALQSMNLLTSEIQLELKQNSISAITFDRAALAFDPPLQTAQASQGGGALVVTLQNFTVSLESKFNIGVDVTNPLVSWTTGVKRIGEKGLANTKVTSRTLQLRFDLIPATKGRHGAAFILSRDGSLITPFTTIEPKFKLEESKLNIAAEIVNVITSSLREQIAAAASLIIKKFVQDLVRDYLQSGLDGVEEKLTETGIELPLGLRAVKEV